MGLIGLPMFITREMIIIALYVSLLVACCLLAYVIHLSLHKNQIESTLIHRGPEKTLLDVTIAGYAIHIVRLGDNVLKKHFNIAIFLFANNADANDVRNAFIATLQELPNAQFTFKHYNACCSPNMLAQHVEDIKSGEYDLIFSIGSHCTQLLKDEIKLSPHNNTQTPLLFSAVHNRIQAGMLRSGYSASHSFCLTGVVGSEHKYYVQISLLKSLIPSIKKILLLCGPTSVWCDEKKVTSILNDNYIEVHKIELGPHDDMRVKIVPYLSDVQLVMSLKDETIMSTVDRLISLCNEHKKPLFTSDLGSVKLGAALGFGTLQDRYGVESARYAQLILQQNIKPADIPVLFLKENDLLLINKKAARQQGLEIDNQIVELIEYGEIFRS
jgi:putative ABC transport system substrate-binding protein